MINKIIWTRDHIIDSHIPDENGNTKDIYISKGEVFLLIEEGEHKDIYESLFNHELAAFYHLFLDYRIKHKQCIVLE